MREVPVSEFQAYKKFCKIVDDDYADYVGVMETHVTLASYAQAVATLPDSANATAMQAFNDGLADFQRGTYQMG
jgi:hypothetical protein